LFHIIHKINNKKIDDYGKKSESAFMITNKKGNYLSLGDKNFSHTQGLFFFDNKKWNMFKSIESITLNQSLFNITNNFYNAQRNYNEGAVELFNLFNNSMIYSVKNYKGNIRLTLDFRYMFAYDDKGRIYSISQEDDLIIIRYDKYSDNTLSSLMNTRYFVIKGVKDFSIINKWIKKNYSYDEKRGSKSEFHVYDALKLFCEDNITLVFSFSSEKEEAKMHAKNIYDNKNYFINSLKKYVSNTFTSRNLALNTAMKALDDLLVSVNNKERNVGIFAGLPWFFQFWARDELISLKALMLQEKYPVVKSILFRYLEAIDDNGFIPNRMPGSSVNSIDGVGWLFLRISEYIKLLISKKRLNDYISLEDLIHIKIALEKSIKGLIHSRLENGLIINNVQETWMDTKTVNRSGACIEIQALFLAMINIHNYLSKLTKTKQVFKRFEKEHKIIVKKRFYKNKMLLDNLSGVVKSETRPNIFIAYYIYPFLLSKKEWKTAFDNALKELWLGWGGLSSVSQKSNSFASSYSGENNISYHNGDSWYYVNNLAAIAMYRLDKKYYYDKIKRIISASKEELLFSGFIGCSAEVSSAKHMKSDGCLSQAWSSATFIEFAYEK